MGAHGYCETCGELVIRCERCRAPVYVGDVVGCGILSGRRNYHGHTFRCGEALAAAQKEKERG